MESLYGIDVWLFRLGNEAVANPVFDVLMVFLTKFKQSWPIAAFAAIFVLVRRKWDGVAIIFLCGLAIGIADQTASGFFKPLFERTRPCFALEEVRLLVRQVRSYSFASSHAANTASVATVIWLFFANSGHKIDKAFAIFLAIYAAAVAYSRVYVGVHYPSDIAAGMLIGVLSGSIVYTAYGYVVKNYIMIWREKRQAKSIGQKRFD
ncbi:phosphoesterase PA-phosphatase related [Chloroherpeton thalassium ATCC 35110]|uniref:Phosphoesterase PA-phosphatase related n=1 Tax=Chloroherpeton thalassium (strain ATCC 35110 / GB-78) TaxID=517418 RepID=B3QYV5_CHLT3|nr:phosphatase PAP2 family protein [Chloroherpeton thalassium]ACF15178.1 phosphoesterase PA-phosphatase related [Chloroherpeton thalassium ATCC 35110]